MAERVANRMADILPFYVTVLLQLISYTDPSDFNKYLKTLS